MFGLLLYIILSCTIQLHVANCQSQNYNETFHETSTPIEMKAPSTVQSSKTMSQSSSVPAHSETSPGSQPTPVWKFFNNSPRPVLLLVGGLIIACTILILSTLVLAWKVCLLSKRVSALSSSADLISQTECTRGTAARKSSVSETALGECIMLTDEHLHEGKGGTEEEEGAANKDMAEEAEDAAKEEEATPPPTENSSSPAPQEEAAKAGSTSEGTDKPKDEV